MTDAKSIFFVESRELLDTMEKSLLTLEKNNSDTESLDAVFRAVHTIKGNSGMFGFSSIEDFTHIIENILESMRHGDVPVDNKISELLLDCRDFIEVLVNACDSNSGQALDTDNDEYRQDLEDALMEYLGSGTADLLKDKTPGTSSLETGPVINGRDSGDTVINDCWHISLRPGKEVFNLGLDPFSFIKYLESLGEIAALRTIYDDMPCGKNMDPELCYLGFEIDFRGNTDRAGLAEVFEFMQDDCEIRILPPKSSVSDYVRMIEELSDEPMRIGEILREIGSITDSELSHMLEMQKSNGEPDTLHIGNILVQENMVQQSVVNAALEKQKSMKKRDEQNRKLIRIEADKLDNLINLIGELVIVGSNVRQLAGSRDSTGLVEVVENMSRLIEEIRESTMNVRMVQIGETFQRFERVVRDLSRERGKEIDLVIKGGETELDKTLIDKMSDPLIHLIRNALDHGIDTPDVRIKKGKRARGTITLNAFHETGSIVIEVKDDGNGLDTERIFQKSVDLGLISPDQNISDYDLIQNIFEPGFSTAEKVTNISGRGVGMDVVRKSIESIRGSVQLESEKGTGTIVRIHLPLTLAIIDGFMVSVADSYYVIPLDMVLECTEVQRAELDSKEGGNFLNLRGDVLPFIRMREFFGEENAGPEKPKVVVVEHAGRRAGLVVDDLIGEFQTVIKPLGRIFNGLRWISGSTIIGNGEVAYILDIQKLVQNIRNTDLSEISAGESARG